MNIRIRRGKTEGRRNRRCDNILSVMRGCRISAVRAGKTIAACFMTICLTTGLFNFFGAGDTFAASSPFISNSYSHNSKFNGNLILNGVDVSWYQATGSNWKTAKSQGVDFAILRTTWTTYAKGSLRCDIDSHFTTHYKKAKAQGILCGAYHFSQATTVAEAKKEANYAIDRLEACGIGPEDLELPVYMDYEYAGNSRTGRLYGISSATAKKCAKAFCNTVRERGYKPGIYANLLFFRNMLNNCKGFDKDIDLWCAQYYSMCQSECNYTKWQYSSSGIIGSKKNGMLSEYTGKVGYTDINFWYIDKKSNTSAETATEIYGPTWFNSSSTVPTFAVYQGTKLLKQDVDYIVRVIENTGTSAYAYIRGIGDYNGYALIPLKFGTKYVERTKITSKMVSNHKAARGSSDLDDQEDGDALAEGAEGTESIDENDAENAEGADGSDENATGEDASAAVAEGSDENEDVDAETADGASAEDADSAENAEDSESTGKTATDEKAAATSAAKNRGAAASEDADKESEESAAANDDSATEYAETAEVSSKKVTGEKAFAAVTAADPEDADVTEDADAESAEGEEGTNANEDAAAGSAEGDESNADNEGDADTDADTAENTDPAESGDELAENADDGDSASDEAAEASVKEEGNYKIATKYISGIEAETTVKTFLSRLDAGSGYTLKVISNTGKERSGTTVLKTGMMLGVYKGTKLAGTAELRVDGSRISGLANYLNVFVKKTYIKDLTSGSKQFSVTVNKVKMADGYEVKYSVNSNLSKYSRKTISTSGSVTSGTVTGLKGNTTYYVKSRAYKTVKGTKFYSGWSLAKTVRTN